MCRYYTNQFHKYKEIKRAFKFRYYVDIDRTAKSLSQALEKANTSFIKVTGCQLMCLSRVGGISKLRLIVLNDFLEEKYGISIAKIPNERSIYLVAFTKDISLQTDDQLMIEIEHRNLCECDCIEK